MFCFWTKVPKKNYTCNFNCAVEVSRIRFACSKEKQLFTACWNKSFRQAFSGQCSLREEKFSFYTPTLIKKSSHMKCRCWNIVFIAPKIQLNEALAHIRLTQYHTKIWIKVFTLQNKLYFNSYSVPNGRTLIKIFFAIVLILLAVLYGK